MTDESPRVGDVIDKYEIDGVVGRGGMGAVFRARHVLTGRQVALKWMLPDPGADAAAVQRFLREARAMGRIDHPNVVGVIDVGVGERSAYLVMELLRGRSLRAYVEEEQRLPPERAVSLLLPALEGVAAAHRAGVVHRDLKPENLFVVEREDGRPLTTKVLDFGISKLREEGPQPPSGVPITHTGTTMGTPSYMSPEQVQGARDVDARTDVWALGAIVYEMVTGRVPFRAQTYGGLMVAIVTEPLVPSDVVAPDLPLALARAIDRALEKDPDARFPSVEALRDALAPFAAESSQPRAVVSPSGPTERPSTPRPPALVDSAKGRASATPTRPGRPERAAPSDPASAQASVPLSVPDLPARSGARRGLSWLAWVGLLAAGCVAAIALIAVRTAMQEREEPAAAPAPASHSASTAAPAPTPAPAPEPASASPLEAAVPAIADAGVAPAAAASEPEPRPRSRGRAPRARDLVPAPAPEPGARSSGRSGQLSRDEF